MSKDREEADLAGAANGQVERQTLGAPSPIEPVTLTTPGSRCRVG
jgi:hypothetical protein